MQNEEKQRKKSPKKPVFAVKKTDECRQKVGEQMGELKALQNR